MSCSIILIELLYLLQELCKICNEKETKYKCPRCNTKTCSLKCVQEHKLKQNCSGIRDRTALIHKEDMCDLTLLNDYRYFSSIFLFKYPDNSFLSFSIYY